MTAKVLFALACLCLVYYLIIVSYAGFQAAFSKFWILMGALLFLGSWCFGTGIRLPGWLNYGLASILSAGFILFVLVETRIFINMKRREVPDLPYIIVLGAQVKGSRVSRTLAWRLNRAAEYLRANSRTKAVLSGGMGPGEKLPEAEAMREYLIEKGIAPGRLIMENQSKNTKENLSFTGSVIGLHAAVGIVTSNFHIYRSLRIAKRLGFSGVYGIPAPSSAIMQPNNLVREFFAVLKDRAVGNL